MHNITDLNITKEILPLFDYTYNDFAKQVLIQLLNNVPNNLEDVLCRQKIIIGCNSNWEILHSFSYSKIDLNEVYQYLKKLESDNTIVQGHKLRVKLFLSEKEKYRTQARLTQLIQLFHRINSLYLSRIKLDAFPLIFQEKLKNMYDFLNSFNLIKYNQVIEEKGLKLSHIVELVALINDKIKNDEIVSFWKDFFLFEAYISIATGIQKNQFTFPIFQENIFSLTEFYHPLLKNPITNNLSFNNNIVLITGPNMSGKSTLLKAISLCVYLGHLGLGVPAAECRIPFFNIISVAINLSDDLKNGYSHFMTEIMNLKKVALQARVSQKCFAVFDELFRGTNIDDALELTEKTIHGLSKFKGSFFIISTHLYQLRDTEEISKNKVSSFYLDCSINNKSPNFSYHLKNGWSNLKIGKILFEKEGLDEILK